MTMKEKRAMTVQVKPIFLALEQVAAALSLSESTVQRLVREESFPKPRLLSGRRTAWLVREVEEWAEARPVSDQPPPPNCDRSRASSTVDTARSRGPTDGCSGGSSEAIEAPSLALKIRRRVDEKLARNAESAAAWAKLNDEIKNEYGLPEKPYIRRHELRRIVPLSDTTIYELERKGEFPKRFSLSPRCVVWYLDEVSAWVEARRTGAVKIKTVMPPPVRKRKYRPVSDPT